jgi:hypothetical protein
MVWLLSSLFPSREHVLGRKTALAPTQHRHIQTRLTDMASSNAQELKIQRQKVPNYRNIERCHKGEEVWFEAYLHRKTDRK